MQFHPYARKNNNSTGSGVLMRVTLYTSFLQILINENQSQFGKFMAFLSNALVLTHVMCFLS